LKPIATNVPGIEVSEQLPLMARCADKYTIVRGVTHTVADHGLGIKYMATGNRPLPSLEFPSVGAIVAKELTSIPEMPTYVSMVGGFHQGGYLGVRCGPFQAGASGKGGGAGGLERRSTN